jgi:superfamily I DNA/RNA helicase
MIFIVGGEHFQLSAISQLREQPLFSWRGARPQNLVLLSQDFPALQVIKLEQNYRSSGPTSRSTGHRRLPR